MDVVFDLNNDPWPFADNSVGLFRMQDAIEHLRDPIKTMKEMSPLEEIRHSSAHILATAVLRLFPKAQLDIGPPTDSGFYRIGSGGTRTFSLRYILVQGQLREEAP